MKAAVPLLILLFVLIFALVAHADTDNGCGGPMGAGGAAALVR